MAPRRMSGGRRRPGRGLPALRAADERVLIPASLPKPQQENLLKFLKEHETPDRYVPKGAKVVGDAARRTTEPDVEPPPKDKPIKQYTVQITPHRPVPGQEEVKQADVYFYRPNPEKGKPGITVKHTVDLTTGKQVGETEVLTKHHTPVSREELAEAVAAAKEKSAAVKDFYTGPRGRGRAWEYLQMKINRKNEQYEPGDRVVRFVFTADAGRGRRPAPTPVRVIVNLTRDTVIPTTASESIADVARASEADGDAPLHQARCASSSQEPPMPSAPALADFLVLVAGAADAAARAGDGASAAGRSRRSAGRSRSPRRRRRSRSNVVRQGFPAAGLDPADLTKSDTGLGDRVGTDPPGEPGRGCRPAACCGSRAPSSCGRTRPASRSG